VLVGPNGVAGEWGHNPLPWATAEEIESAGNYRCFCGRRGCIEALVCGPAIARDHAARHGGSLDAAAIAHHAAAGDSAARATLDRHAQRLARALASVINLLDPDVIVLGGGLSQMPHLYADVPHLWGEWVVGAGPGEPVRTRLLPPVHGDSSGVRGAAWVGRWNTREGAKEP
jgi:fructokinase